MMEYKGYVGKVEFDDEAGVLYGEVINIRDVITYIVTKVFCHSYRREESLKPKLNQRIRDSSGYHLVALPRFATE